MHSQKITTFFWFPEQQAEAAARFYVSLLPDSRVLNVSPMATTFELAGSRYIALNGNPGQEFSDALSLFVECDDQSEVDRLWTAFTADGGKPGRCGWLKDKFGVSWQIIPKRLGELMGEPKVVQAMMKMSKIDIAELERAHGGEA